MRSTWAITRPPEFFAAIASGQIVQRQRLALHRDVAGGIGGGAADQGDVDRERLVEQPLLAVDLDQPDEILGGACVDLAAALARIDEGAQSDLGERAGACAARCRGTGARCMPERQVVGLDAVRRSPAAPSLGTSPQWPPTARLSSPHGPAGSARAPCRRPARRRTAASGRAARRVARSAAPAPRSAPPACRCRRSPRHATVSPSRTSATASSALTTLSRIMLDRSLAATVRALAVSARRASVALLSQSAMPLPSTPCDLPLTNTPTWPPAGRARCSPCCRPRRAAPASVFGGMMWSSLREDVEHRHRDAAQVHLAPAELELALDQLVVLVQVLTSCLAASPGWCGRSASHFSMRRKFSSFFSSSKTSSRPTLYLVSVAPASSARRRSSSARRAGCRWPRSADRCPLGACCASTG